MDRAENRVFRTCRAMKAARRRRRFGAWLGLAALAPHLLMVFALSVAQAQAAPASAERALVTCVVYGQGTGKPKTDRKQKNSRTDCPVCQSETLCKNLLPAAAATAPPPSLTALARLTGPAPAPAYSRNPVRQLPRGPPHT